MTYHSEAGLRALSGFAAFFLSIPTLKPLIMKFKSLAAVAVAAFLAGSASIFAANPKPFTVPEVRE